MTSLPDRLQRRIECSGLSLEKIKSKLKKQHIETPSWGYADSGTRFGVFKQAAAAKTLAHKLEDAATVHRYTGIAPSVALHIPWDLVTGAPCGSKRNRWGSGSEPSIPMCFKTRNTN